MNALVAVFWNKEETTTSHIELVILHSGHAQSDSTSGLTVEVEMDILGLAEVYLYTVIDTLQVECNP